jgi:hypothetical protein
MPPELKNIVEWLAAVGISGATSGAFVFWLTKTWVGERIRNQIKAEYDSQLETLKARLKAESDVEIERLRSQLSIVAAERQFRFSHLHEKRAEAIEEVYAALRNALSAMADYVKLFEPGGDVSRPERAKVAAERGREFGKLYHSKRIFIPKDTATKLDQVDKEIVQSFNVFHFMVDQQPEGKHDPKAWLETYSRIDKLSKSPLEDLEADFRRLLGEEA